MNLAAIERAELAEADNVDKSWQIKHHTTQLAFQQPKADFYDEVTGSKDGIDIGTVSKVLDLGFGRTTLFQKLRENGILMSQNVPYQKYMDNGWFRTIETKYTKPDGGVHIYIKTLVLQKGVDGIRKLFLGKSI
jgi:phage antirepressor YoqD-like protein